MKSSLAYSFNQADLFLRAGNLLKAAEHYRCILKALPRNEKALVKLATIHAYQNEWTEVVRIFKTLCNINPQSLFYKVRLLAALGKNGEISEARKLLDDAESLGASREHLETMAEIAYLPTSDRQTSLIDMLNNGESASTEIAARFFIDDYPNHPLGYQVLCINFIQQEKFEDALSTSKISTRLFPKDANCFYQLAQVEKKLGMNKPALTSFNKAKRLNPKLQDTFRLESDLMSFSHN